MPSFSDWYSRQYAAWNRTRRLRTTPYLARTETNTSRRATALAAAAGVENTQFPTNVAEAGHPTDKRQETLFGPNIGIVSDGPAWAQSEEAKKGSSSDYLTPEIVTRWVETSKETVQPTTTLQALVNLKRPTIRLSPLTIHPSEDPSEDPSNPELHSNHALEFEYDCDAPKCSITAQVIVPSKESNPSGDFGPLCQRITVYDSVFEGGFGRLLKLEDGATIELGRFEHMPHDTPGVSVDQPLPKVEKNLVTTEIISEPSETPSNHNPTPSPTPENQENARKRRFTALHFRRRSQNRSVSGPALAVLDHDTTAVTENGDKEKDLQSDDGVRVVIQLVALDDSGKELSSVNRQSTYLHVVRLGTPATGGEDNRPWVVKVVKREATIGPHTFHLHEIFGLSSTSVQATVPADNQAVHTYPPIVPAPAEDEPSSECLVCLSSPREVVLLPCRHLVACKECAINMVEFGAGGAIMHAEEPATAEPQATEAAEPPPADESVPPAVATSSSGEDASPPMAATEGERDNTDPRASETSQNAAPPLEGGDTATAPPSTPAPAPSATIIPSSSPNDPPTLPAPQHPRRRRRAKGWSCPVCRQPYTSLLRITTTPPTMEGGKEGKRVSTSTLDHPLGTTTSTAAGLARPSPALESTAEEPMTPSSRSLRPMFLRGLSLRAAEPVSPV